MAETLLKKGEVGDDIEIDWGKEQETTKQPTVFEQTLQAHLAWHCDGIWESIQTMHPDWDGVQLTIIHNKETGQRYINITTLRRKE